MRDRRNYARLARFPRGDETQDASLPAPIEGAEDLSGPDDTKVKHDAALRRGEKEDSNMSTHTTVPTSTHTDFLQLQKHWEAILRDAGLTPEPTPLRNATTLPKDPSQDFQTDKSFFERNSDAIFEAKQQWKQVGLIQGFCLLCGYEFWDRAGTKFCCDNHRKRFNEGKEICDGCGAYFIPPANPKWKKVRTVSGSIAVFGGPMLCKQCEANRNEQQ
jgi:hypothetical protein